MVSMFLFKMVAVEKMSRPTARGELRTSTSQERKLSKK
jgi:hypothetical protein